MCLINAKQSQQTMVEMSSGGTLNCLPFLFFVFFFFLIVCFSLSVFYAQNITSLYVCECAFVRVSVICCVSALWAVSIAVLKGVNICQNSLSL